MTIQTAAEWSDVMLIIFYGKTNLCTFAIIKSKLCFTSQQCEKHEKYKERKIIGHPDFLIREKKNPNEDRIQIES